MLICCSKNSALCQSVIKFSMHLIYQNHVKNWCPILKLLSVISHQNKKNIYLNVLSLIDARNCALDQIFGSQIANDHSRFKAEQVKHKLNLKSLNTQEQNHNVTLQYIHGGAIKSKKDIIVIPCATEFACTGRFLSLNKSALIQVMKYEDFFIKIRLKTKSADIEISDIFLINDYKITKKQKITVPCMQRVKNCWTFECYALNKQHSNVLILKNLNSENIKSHYESYGNQQRLLLLNMKNR